MPGRADATAACRDCGAHSGIETRQDGTESSVKDVWRAVEQLRDKLIGRPSWMVVLVITTVVTTLFGAVCYLSAEKWGTIQEMAETHMQIRSLTDKVDNIERTLAAMQVAARKP